MAVTPSDSVVVIPTFNEAGNIAAVIDRILALSPRFDILVVDDNSPDGTADLVEAIAARPDYAGRIRVLRRPGKQGLGTAYRDAFREVLKSASYGFVFQMDADLSHSPEALPALRTRLEGADLVIGSRYAENGATSGWPLRRLLLSRLGNGYLRLVLGRLPVRDVTGGFKGMRRAVLESLDLDRLRAKGYVFQVEVNYHAHRAGHRIAEVPILFTDRTAGQSKMSWRIVAEAFILPWALRFLGMPSRRGRDGAEG